MALHARLDVGQVALQALPQLGRQPALGVQVVPHVLQLGARPARLLEVLPAVAQPLRHERGRLGVRDARRRLRQLVRPGLHRRAHLPRQREVLGRAPLQRGGRGPAAVVRGHVAGQGQGQGGEPEREGEMLHC